MAERFATVAVSDVETLANKAKNKNTIKSTKTWVKLFEAWASAKDANTDILSYEVEQLDKTLCIFFAEVRKSDGTDYEPDSLRVMLSSLDRYLKDNDKPFSIARDREFVKSRAELEGKARELREQGQGKRPNATRALNASEEEKLWSTGVLGDHTPTALVHTMWYLLTLHFGLRGCQEHHSMTMEDFTLHEDDQGCEYLTFEESQTKTRQGGLRKKRRVVQPKMFAIGGNRCPIKHFKAFVSHRPEEMKYSGPFYLGVVSNPNMNQQWYKRQRMGVNTINTFMKSMAEAAGLTDEGSKKLTNHCVRKTLVKKLKASKQPRSAIIGETGHTNERSLADYEEGDENEQREISSILSAPMGQIVPQPQRNPLQSIPEYSDVQQSSFRFAVNHFHGCQVTINYTCSQGSVNQEQRIHMPGSSGLHSINN